MSVEEEPETDAEGFAPGARPICPFCSKRWTAHMMRMYEDCEIEEGYYGGVDGVTLTVNITCDGCERLIYRKEVDPRRDSWI